MGILSRLGLAKAYHDEPAPPIQQAVSRDALSLGLYHSFLNAEEIVLRHEDRGRNSVPGHLVNYLGVATDIRYVGAFSHLGGVVEGPPIPCNNHAELVEWAAVLRAVELSNQCFTVVELGAGWGCWMVNSAVAAKRLGRDVYAIGVEGDQEHSRFIAEHAFKNGLAPREFDAVNGVVGPAKGVALFPVVEQSCQSYGQEPQFFDSDDSARRFLEQAVGDYISTPILALEQVLGGRDRVDLLHIDIQGAEATFIKECIGSLDRRVAYIVVGTHSRAIEGELINFLHASGWRMEFEKPCTLSVDPSGSFSNIRDGTQGWQNSRLF